MKAVIVELRKNNAAALTDDGCVIKLKNRNYTIGQVIEVGKIQKINKRKFAIFAAYAAALVIIFGISIWAYFTPYTYVSLDVNPSVEFEVNRFDRVLSATAVNDDGSEILQNINVDNMKINKAVNTTVNKIEQEGYFDGQDPGGIIISTSSENMKKAQKIAEELQDTTEEVIEDNTEPVEVETISVGLQRVSEAHDLGTTPGKLNLIQKMQKSSNNPNEINVEEWSNKPVKEIMKIVKQNRKKAKINTKQNNKKNASSKLNISEKSHSLPCEQNSRSDSSALIKGNNSNKSKSISGSKSSRGNNMRAKTARKSESLNNNKSNNKKFNNHANRSNRLNNRKNK